MNDYICCNNIVQNGQKWVRYRAKQANHSTIIMLFIMEKQLKREEIYSGKVIHVVKDEVVLDDGTKTLREVVIHNGGVCIALKDNGYYYLVKQYRYSHEKEMLEFPAGKIEKGEEPDNAIVREVEEETGFTAKNIKKLGYVIPTCGYSSEKIYLYYGEVDSYVGQHFDVDERLGLEKYTFKQLKEMVKNHIIDDGKTIALMYQIELEGLDA